MAELTLNFEAGDLSEWDATLTDGGDLAADAAAAQVGSYGMKAVIDDTVSLYGLKTFDNKSEIRVGFYFHPNGISMGTGENFVICGGGGSFPGGSDYRVYLYWTGSQYQVRVSVQDDVGWTDTAWVTISNAWHWIEIHCKRSTGSNNGFARLWIDIVDGTPDAEATGIDDDTRDFDSVICGTNLLDAGTSGTIYWDYIRANDTGTEIGPPSSAVSFSAVCAASTSTPNTVTLSVVGEANFVATISAATSTPDTVTLSVSDEYYISPTGDNGSGDGSQGNPWETLAYALSQVPAGSTVFCMNGTWDVTTGVTSFLSGVSQSEPTLVKALNRRQAIFKKTATGSPDYGTFDLTAGYSYIRLEGLVFETDDGAGGWINDENIRLQNDSYIWIIDCELRDTTFHVIAAWGNCDHIYIEDCDIHAETDTTEGGVGDCLHVGNAPNNTYFYIRRNTVYHSSHAGIDVNSVDYCWIEDNVVHDNESHNISLGAADGAPYTVDHCYVTGNKSYRAGAFPTFEGGSKAGIRLHKGLHRAEIRNNEFYENGAKGVMIHAYVVGPAMVGPVYIENNVFYNNNQDRDAAENDIYFYREPGCSDEPTVYFRNNILVTFSGTGGLDWRVLYVTTGFQVNMTLDYNCYYAPYGYEETRVAGSTEYSFEAYIAARETHSIDDDPEFVNPGAYDFHLQGTSPCIDAGLDVGEPYHGSAPDMGAYETSTDVSFAAVLAAVSATPGNVLLSVDRAFVAVIAAVTVTPDNLSLPLSRAMVAVLGAAMSTPDDANITLSGEVAFSAIINATSNTPDAVTLSGATDITNILRMSGPFARQRPVLETYAPSGQLFRHPRAYNRSWSTFYGEEGGGFGAMTWKEDRAAGVDYPDVGFGYKARLRKGLCTLLFDGTIIDIEVEERGGVCTLTITAVGWGTVFAYDTYNQVYREARPNQWTAPELNASSTVAKDRFNVSLSDAIYIKPRRTDFRAGDYAFARYQTPNGEDIGRVAFSTELELPNNWPGKLEVRDDNGVLWSSYETARATKEVYPSADASYVDVRFTVTQWGENTAEEDTVYGKMAWITVGRDRTQRVTATDIAADLVAYMEEHGIAQDAGLIEETYRDLPLTVAFETDMTPSEALSWATQFGGPDGELLAWGVELEESARLYLERQDLETVKYVIRRQLQSQVRGSLGDSAQKLYVVWQDADNQIHRTSDFQNSDQVEEQGGFYRRIAYRVSGTLDEATAEQVGQMRIAEDGRPKTRTNFSVGDRVYTATGKAISFDEIQAGGMVLVAEFAAAEAGISDEDLRSQWYSFQLVGVEVDEDSHRVRLIPAGDPRTFERFLARLNAYER